jgi:serine/threonine protein kinase/tetratricopeptide (TPR) repeat protein
MLEFRPAVSNPQQDDNSLSGVVAGRFVIGERLGKGGMGEVYRAEDLKLKRTVALKRLAPQLRADPVYRRRFQQEAERVSRFSDAHVAAVYDVLEEQGEMFFVMEYVEGQTLRRRLRSAMTLEQFFGIAKDCAQALIAAHDSGIIHCDIKPENIMLATNGHVKILDFGVAKHLPRSDQSSTVDRTGGMGGTPAYMSPEVLLERVPDARADIFSLGVVFYEVLTGNHPFMAGSFVATSDRIRNETPTPIRIFNSKVPQQLEALVYKAMAKDPARRQQSVHELFDELQAAETGVTPARGARLLPPQLKQERKPVLSQPSLVAAGIVVVLLIAAFFGSGQIRRLLSLSRPGSIHLAVLPFTSTGNDPGTKAFCDGLTETLAAKLTQLSGNHPLQVVPTSEVRAEGVTNVEQAKKDFGVNYVLEGSLHASGDQVRVTYSLVDTKLRRQIHAGSIDGSAADAFGVEDRVVDGVLGLLGLEIQTNDRVVLAAHGTSNPSAYDQYLRGRGYLLDYHKPENIDNAIASFNRALSSDPKYAQAFAGLGQAYWRGYEEGQHGTDWTVKARSACESAVADDPKSAEGYACLGTIYSGTGEYEKSALQFQKATALDPTSDEAFRGLASAAQKLNRPAEAEATYKRAIALRPQYWAGYSWLGNFYFRQGRYDDAVKMFQEVISLSPDNFQGYFNLGALYVVQARYPEAIRTLEKSIEIRPTVDGYINRGTAYFCLRKFTAASADFEQGLNLDKTSYLVWGNLGDAYYWAPGKRQQADDAYREALRLADEVLRVNPREGTALAFRATYLAMLDRKDEAVASIRKAVALSPKDPDVRFRGALVYNHFEDTEQTLEWLHQALAAGVTAASVRDTPDFDHLRDDPRLQALLRAQHS